MILFSDKIVNGTPETGIYGRWFTDKIMNGTPESGVYGRWFTDKIMNGTPESGVYGGWFTDKVVNSTPESWVYGRHVKEDIQINFTLRYDTESVHIEEKKMKINNQEESWVLNTPEMAQVFSMKPAWIYKIPLGLLLLIAWEREKFTSKICHVLDCGDFKADN